MISNIRLIFLFIVLVLIQVLVLNNVLFSGYINPYLYVYFILALPFSTPRWLVLVLAFVLGLTIDFFSNSAGIHAAATTFIGYMRYHVLGLLKPREGYDTTKAPSVRDMSMSWYFIFSGLLIFMHHFVYFLLEVFRFSDLWTVLMRTLISTLFTLLLVIIVQLLFGKQRESE